MFISPTEIKLEQGHGNIQNGELDLSKTETGVGMFPYRK